MLKVGIFAPYVRSETTLAAVQFADWLLRCGIAVEFVAEDKIHKGIHPVWDKKVKSPTRRHIYKWAAAATHLCWFAPSGSALYYAGLVTKSSAKQRTKQLFFPTWSNWTKEHEFFTLTADRTICLSRDMSVWLDERYDKDQTNRTWANLVAPAKIVIPKHGLTNLSQRRLLVVLGKAFDLDLDPGFIDEFSILLALSEIVHITFLLDKSLPKVYRQRLRNLKKYFSERVQIVRDLPYYDYTRLARQHDWVYLTSTRHTYGSLMSALLVSSVPMLCHKLPPAEAQIQDGTTGRLIPCHVYNTKSPIAEVESTTVIEMLNSALHLSEATLKTFQHNLTGYLERKQNSFCQFILKEFVQ